MKLKIITMTLVFASVFAFNNVKSQDFMFSAGVDLVLPLGDFGDLASFGAGVTLGGEYPVSDNIGLTAQVGYDLLFVDSELSDFIKSMSMIPAQVGVKYYFDEVGEGVYAHGQVGIHSMSTKTEDIDLGILGTIEGETTSDSNLSFAIGAGTIINETIDLGLRFNIITTDVEGADASNYIGVRGAFIF